jgi:translation initiation factor 5A
VSKPVELTNIKEGSYLIIDGAPCRVVSYDKSKPGKHGAAKARVVGIGLFDGVKRSLVSPVSANVEVPIIDKKAGQIISVSAPSAQIMDLSTFEVFDALLPTEGELEGKLVAGADVEYWEVMGRRKLVRVKGGA